MVSKMIIDGKNNYSIYKITTRRQHNIKKIIILILLFFIVIGLIMITKNSIDIINRYKVYQQYESQLVVLQEQKNNEIEIEKEQKKIKQDRIPQLTQER